MITNVGEKVADISDIYEKENNSLKVMYINENVDKYREIVRPIKLGKGNFETGYPFYIKADETGVLPIIDEQLRYNNDLRIAQENSKTKIWPCETCLRRNGDKMPDLKQICKPCTKVINELKPRKVINRLPDIDAWFICEDGSLIESSEIIKKELTKQGFSTSDVDPIKTINDLEEITYDLKNGIMPKKSLPIDTHIIEYSELMKKIKSLPDEIAEGIVYEHIPFIPIHPLSLRKDWQYDDTAYNFVHDFISSFTEDSDFFDDKMLKAIKSVREKLKSTYTIEELYNVLLETGNDATIRRQKHPVLKKSFEERIKSW